MGNADGRASGGDCVAHSTRGLPLDSRGGGLPVGGRLTGLTSLFDAAESVVAVLVDTRR